MNRNKRAIIASIAAALVILMIIAVGTPLMRHFAQKSEPEMYSRNADYELFYRRTKISSSKRNDLREILPKKNVNLLINMMSESYNTEKNSRA